MDTRTHALHSDQHALLAALTRVLQPLAALCIARGVTIQAVEELLRRAFVAAARSASDGVHPDRQTSRISTITGLTRREVSRLAARTESADAPARSLATEVLARWTSSTGYTDARGRPRVLPRLGPAPSFDALAATVTRDVHARTLLSELERLHLVSLNTHRDTVTLLREAFVPHSDWPQMVGFLGANVGDHLQAAVANVLGAGDAHFEQSLLADELSAQAIAQARTLIAEQWRSLMTTLGPRLQQLMDDDQATGRPQDQALRIGLYSWTAPMAHEQDADPGTHSPPPSPPESQP